MAFVDSSDAEPNLPRALIVAGGLPISSSRLQVLAGAAACIVAVDSGLITVESCGLTPTVVIGDMDSAPPDRLTAVPERSRHHDPNQDDTDLEKAIRWTFDRGLFHADVVGATGDRLDHSVNAVSLMLKYRRQVRIILHDEGGWAFLAEESPLVITGQAGDRISLIPAPAAHGISSQGLRYPLQDSDLYIGGHDGISNQLLSARAELSWREGSFLIYWQTHSRDVRLL